ncbi:MaoC family dehydratase [Gordonia sp. TBRC 11910]|uniref:MaoC family dehydratase n=1 Tax=Gordonia asplenii TaxID=2725283 RepID=A0A848KPJ0_9ACTN|nr:MaoC family dehydratase [Gordonia asplenii]NMO00954.1 MaoC family dehydratase [Gordonia asplenii]
MTLLDTQQISVGDTLPPLVLDATPTFVVSTALATRDFQDVHHDRDLAQQKGSKDIFVNILTDTGLVERFVTDWAGPSARIASISLKLGVPWYAYDTLTFTGEVVGVSTGSSAGAPESLNRQETRPAPPIERAEAALQTERAQRVEITVAVTGTNSLGKHVISTVTFTKEVAA